MTASYLQSSRTKRVTLLLKLQTLQPRTQGLLFGASTLTEDSVCSWSRVFDQW